MPTLDEILNTITQREEVIADVQDTITQDWRGFSKGLTNALSASDRSHASFADAIGVHPSFLSRILSGEKRWSFKLARKAIAALNPPTNG